MATPAADEEEKRQKFGTRFLTDPQNVFKHNAWDNVVWDEEQETEAKSITFKQMENMCQKEKIEEYESKADSFWNTFYSQHQNKFFKDRHWLFTEFPELYGQIQGDDKKSEPEDKSRAENKPISFLEVGCGVGNTVFPLLNVNKNPNLKVFCCDFSSTAIQIVKEHADYDPTRCQAFVYDITDPDMTLPFDLASLDIIIMIFVLSAVCPEKMQAAVDRLASMLRPGGMLLFRDYGRYDMAQLRFKPGRCLGENFYARGDGTRCYFFTQEELRTMFTSAGLVERENLVDRRLQVNRGKQLKMYRVWIQCKFYKPLIGKELNEGGGVHEGETLE